MAGPTIASAEVSVDLDGRMMRIQARAIAKSAGEVLEREMGSGGEKSGRSFSDGFSRGAGSGMDRTVRAVLIAIAAIGPQLATLGSGLSASLVGLLSSALVGLGGSLLALVGPMAAVATGTALVVTGWKDMVAQSTALQAAQAGLSAAWQAQAAALTGQLAPALASLTATLAQVVGSSNIGAALGAAMAQVSAAFEGVLTSPGFTAFIQAMETTLPAAMASLGSGAAGLAQGFAQIFAAAGPAAAQLGAQFAAFGQQFATTMQQMAANGQLAAFFDQAVASINALMGVVSPLAQALGNVFMIGSSFGNAMLGTLGQLAQQFLAFTQSAEGAAQIGQWFAAGQQIFNALLPVVGALGKALAAMVTPQTVNAMTAFLADLASIIPVLGQLMSVIGNVGILEVLGEVLRSIAVAIQPAIPALMQLAGVLGGALMQIVSALSPVFQVLGQVIAQLVPIITPLITALANTLAPILQALAPILAALAQAFMPILQVVVQVASQLLGALMPAIVAILNLVAQLAPGLVQLFVAFNPVLRVITMLLPVITPLISLIAQLVTWLANMIAKAAPLINSVLRIVAQFIAFKGVGDDVVKIVGRIGQWFSKLATTVGGAVSGMVQRVIAFFTRMSTGAGNLVSRMISNVVKFFTNMGTRVGSAVSKLVSNVVNFFTRLWQRVTSSVSSGISRVVGFFTGLPGKVLNAVGTLLGQIISFWARVFTRMGSAITSGISKVIGYFREAPSRILRALTGAATLLYQVGVDIVSGLLNGLKGAWNKVTGWASDAFNSLSSGVKKVLGIGSPSKVFMSIGEDTVRGFVIGFQKQSEKGRSAFRELSASTLNSLTDGLAKGSKEAGKEVSTILARVTDLQTQAIKANQRALANTTASARRGLSGVRETSTIRDLNRYYSAVQQSVRDGGAAIRATIKRNGTNLTSTLKQYETATAQLTAAKKRLDELRKASSELRSSVAGSIQGQLDLSSLTSGSGGAKPTFETVAGYVAGMKSKARSFRSKMQALVKTGLPPAFIQQLAGLGLDGAIEVANALLSGSKSELKQVAADYNAFNSAAGQIGTLVADDMYAAGINSQKALIRGLTEDTGDLKKAAAKLASRLTKYVKAALKIKSPSRVFMDIGHLTMQGLSLGITQGGADALRAARSVMGQLTGVGVGSLDAPQLSGGRGSLPALAAAAAQRSVVVESGAIQLFTPVADPRLVASQVLDRLVTRVG